MFSVSRQDPTLKRCWGVAIEHGNTTLSDDGASIVLRIDQVNRHTRFRGAGGEDGFVHVNAVHPSLRASATAQNECSRVVDSTLSILNVTSQAARAHARPARRGRRPRALRTVGGPVVARLTLHAP
jgi:hypothetical protein